MCEENIYTNIRPDGRTSKRVETSLCKHAHGNDPCEYTKTFNHPTYLAPPGPFSPSYAQFPPTPPSSSHSASDSARSSKKRSGIYVNGQKVLEINGKHSSRRDKGDRVVYVQNPPLSRTPPRQYTLPRSMPSSPNDTLFDVYEPRRYETVVDERDLQPAVKVEVIKERPHKSNHSRHGSSSKTSSSHNSRDEEQLRIASIIARDNASIANRPATVPSAPAPAPRYRRGSVVIDPLAVPMGNLHISSREQLEKERRRHEKREVKYAEQRQREEEEAQRRRLMERMTPSRRATIGPGSRRPKILYEGGLYRYE